MKHIFVLNPTAGKGDSEERLLPAIIQTARLLDLDFEVHRTLSANETISYCRRKLDEISGEAVRFYACGGDGTLNNVLNGMVGAGNAELAYIPCGTGNDFVRNFKDRRNFLHIGSQVAGKAVPIDIMKSGDSYSVNMLNIGIDCDVVVKMEENRENPFIQGSLAYITGAAQVLRKPKAYKLSIEVNGEDLGEQELFLICVAGGCFCGGGFKSAPEASIRDGLMDICIVSPVKGWNLMRLLAKYRLGTHLQDKKADVYIKYLKCKEISISSSEPFPISSDGEIDYKDAINVEVCPQAVRFSIPEGSDFLYE